MQAQTNQKIFYDEFVEGFFDTYRSDSLKVFDSPNGKLQNALKIHLEPGEHSMVWYKIAIRKTEGEWAQIENIMLVPGDNDAENESLLALSNYWVKTDCLTVHATWNTSFYKKPDRAAELLLTIEDGVKLNLLETNGLWAKVSFMHEGTKVIAWIQRKNQCAYPYTTCNWND